MDRYMPCLSGIGGIMKSIFKYVIKQNETILKIPLDETKRILSVCEQKGSIVVYALVDTEAVDVNVQIWVRGTKYEAIELDKFAFLGTVKLYDGELMFHVFYRIGYKEEKR